MDADSIRARIRQMVAANALPCEEGKVWVGRGVGETCVACGQPIEPTETDFEVVFPSGETLRLHGQPCHSLWIEECAQPSPSTR